MNKEKLFADFPYIESDNLILRKIAISEFEEWYDISSSTNQQFTPSKNKSLGKEAAYNVLSKHYDRDFLKRKQIFLGIYRDDILVGNTVIFDIDEKVDMVTIGYSLSNTYCGSGIATRAVEALTKFLFEEIDVNRIQAFVMPENEKSSKVLERNNFLKEGRIRKGYYWTGHGILDLELYAILRCDYVEE